MTAERVNVPMYEQLLLTEWIAGHPDLHGRAVGRHRRRRGRSRRRDRAPDPRRRVPGVAVRGFDIDAPTVNDANEAATAEGLGNLRFEVVDGGSLPVVAFDLVCVFDALHHMTEPDAVLDGIRAALRPGGSLLLAEAALIRRCGGGRGRPDRGDRLRLRPHLLLPGEQDRTAGPGWARRGRAGSHCARAARLR